jgi:hypothetical protein
METTRYSFRAEPLTVQSRAKFRDELADIEPTQQFCNIVVDPRIYRGATYDRRSVLTEKVSRITPYPKKTITRSADQDFDDLHRDGFAESLVQTDYFDGTVIIERKEESVAIQTDPYIEKPIIHRQPPALRAMGVKTDVPGTALFDFNIQVRPIVITLVQKALTQATMEVAEEMELEQMNRYLKAFEQKAKVDAQAIARLEQAEAKKFEEKEARIAERRKLEASQLEIRSKMLARGFAEWFVSDLQDDVMGVLTKHEYFYDEVMREIEMEFLPWLSEQSGLEVAKPSVINALAESALEEGDQFFVEQCNEIEIFDSVAADSREVSHTSLLRKMIPEDIVSAAWRKSKKLGHRKKPGDGEGEEETDEPAASEGGTESTYDSSAS